MAISIGTIVAQKTKKAPQSFLPDKSVAPATMTKAQLLPLLSERFWATDSFGKMIPVSSYTLTFIERGVFFDQEGKPIIVSDYFDMPSEDGVMSKFWLPILEERLKVGDTVRITNPMIYTDLEKGTTLFSPSIIIGIIK